MNNEQHETYINEKAQEIHQQNKNVGWWDDPDRCLLTTLQLINTEIAEATEGERKNLMDDHIPSRKMGEVELADALIRTLDLGAHCELKYVPYPLDDESSVFIAENRRNPAALHLMLAVGVSVFATEFLRGVDPDKESYCFLIQLIIATSYALGYDVIAAMDDKLEYNKTRMDHKRESREEEHGKKF